MSEDEREYNTKKMTKPEPPRETEPDFKYGPEAYDGEGGTVRQILPNAPAPAPEPRPRRCSTESEHAPHTFDGRPMQFCPGVESEWRKCPQCGRENLVGTWTKRGGKCPNCGDLHDKEAGTPETPSALRCKHCGK
jgi:hypothetical protein